MEQISGSNCHTVVDDAVQTATGLKTCATTCAESLTDGAVASLNANSQSETGIDLPRGSRITVAESSDERLVISIPGGNELTPIVGRVALVWNSVLAVMTMPWLAVCGPALGMSRWVSAMFLCFVWAVGFYLLFQWMHEKFSRTFLLLERERLAVKRTFFRWARIDETQLMPDSKAEIVVIGKREYEPIYSVSLAGTDRKATFGTHLSQEEKLWIVRRINQFLGVDAPEWERIRVEQVSRALDPSAVTTESSVTVLESSPERLLLRAPLFAQQLRSFGNVILIAIGLFWIAATIGSLAMMVALSPDAEGTGRTIGIVLGGVSVFVVAPMLLAVAIVNAQTTIELTSRSLRRRRHFGPFGLSREIPTDHITAVRLVTTEALAGNASGLWKRPAKPMTHYTSCIVLMEKKYLWLTQYQQRETSEQVAGLLTNQLAAMRFQVQNIVT